jgi:transposase
MGKRSDVPIPDRREAVLGLVRREESAAVLARRSGASEPTLYRWRDDFLAAGESALAVGTRNGLDPRDRRITELERREGPSGPLVGPVRYGARGRASPGRTR